MEIHGQEGVGVLGVKVARARRNLTQEQLAALAGVTRKTINAIETGRFVPSTALALTLAKVFAVRVEDLFMLDGPAETARDVARSRCSPVRWKRHCRCSGAFDRKC